MLQIWTGTLPHNAPNVGRYQLTHLAIHILSIVANSTGCERLFSEMFHIHTKRRNRLAYSKVFDTAVVRMNLKRNHAVDGLTRSRLKHQFGLSENESTLVIKAPVIQTDQSDEAAEAIADVDMMEDDPRLDFRTVTAQLRQEVIDDEDPTDDEDLTLSESVAAHCPLGAQRPKRVRLFFGTQVTIELKDLFDYESGEGKEGLDSFKQAGIANLEKELEIYNLATREVQEAMESEVILD